MYTSTLHHSTSYLCYAFPLLQLIHSPRQDKTERRAADLLMKGRPITFQRVLPLLYNATMLQTEVAGTATVAYIGSNHGGIEKVSK